MYVHVMGVFSLFLFFSQVDFAIIRLLADWIVTGYSTVWFIQVSAWCICTRHRTFILTWSANTQDKEVVPAGRKGGYSTELNDRTFHEEDCLRSHTRGCSATLYPGLIQQLCHPGSSAVVSPAAGVFTIGGNDGAESDEEVAITFNRDQEGQEAAGDPVSCSKCDALDNSSGKKAGKKKRQGRG